MIYLVQETTLYFRARLINTLNRGKICLKMSYAEYLIMNNMKHLVCLNAIHAI